MVPGSLARSERGRFVRGPWRSCLEPKDHRRSRSRWCSRVTSTRPQVQVTDGAPGAEEPTPVIADTASSDAARLARGPRALALTSALLLILLVVSAALSVRAYVLYQRADSTTTNILGASNDLLVALLNAETGQRGYLLTSRLIYLQPYDAAVSEVPADQRQARLGGLSGPWRPAIPRNAQQPGHGEDDGAGHHHRPGARR